MKTRKQADRKRKNNLSELFLSANLIKLQSFRDVIFLIVEKDKIPKIQLLAYISN